MSIEQKIAEILAESRAAAAGQVEEEVKMAGAEKPGPTDVTAGASAPEASNITTVSDGVTQVAGENEDNKRNNVDKQVAANATPSAADAHKGIKEDINALIDGEELTEEFKEKAATIFEAAVLSRVKQEIAKLDEAYEHQLAEQVEEIKEGLVEKVDGYLDYVVEQWIEQNEIALESGMKSEILEGFVGGLKNLFAEHYIEVPEEKFDVVGALEEEVDELQTKLDEQFATNVAMSKELASFQRTQVVSMVSEGLVDTDKEKFNALVEEIAFEDAATFQKKAQTIRESYFTGKAATTTVVNSIVTDEPVMIVEEKVVPSSMKSYLSVLDNLK